MLRPSLLLQMEQKKRYNVNIMRRYEITNEEIYNELQILGLGNGQNQEIIKELQKEVQEIINQREIYLYKKYLVVCPSSCDFGKFEGSNNNSKASFLEREFSVDLNRSPYCFEYDNNIKAKVKRLIEVVQELKKQVGIPGSIKEVGIDEKSFLKGLDALAEEAFDDQCTGTNPRYPLFPEIKNIYLKAYYGKEEGHEFR